MRDLVGGRVVSLLRVENHTDLAACLNRVPFIDKRLLARTSFEVFGALDAIRVRHNSNSRLEPLGEKS